MTVLPQVVATDCDGTLLRGDGTVSERTRRVLAEVEEAGTRVVLVTARPPRWMDELADLVGGHGTVLCGNGAFTYDVASRSVVSHRLMDRQVAQEILHDLRRELEGVTFAAEGVRGLAREPEFRRASGRSDGEWLVAPVAELLREAPGKILVRHADWTVDELRRRVAEVVGARGEVSHSGAVGLTEIAGPGITKGLALSAWCREHGVGPEGVWAFGDMPNDLPMLTWAGRSFAVANAHPAVARATTDRCPSNDDDGVAKVLEQALARSRA